MAKAPFMPWHFTIVRVHRVCLIWTEFSDTKGYRATLVLIKGKSFVKQIVQPRAMARTFKMLDFYSLSISLFPMMLVFRRTLIPYCFYLLACTLSKKPSTSFRKSTWGWQLPQWGGISSDELDTQQAIKIILFISMELFNEHSLLISTLQDEYLPL